MQRPRHRSTAHAPCYTYMDPWSWPSMRSLSEPCDICAGFSNTIYNNLHAGGDALLDNGRVARAGARSLIPRSLLETRQLCAVTENTGVRAAHKFLILEYRNRQ